MSKSVAIVTITQEKRIDFFKICSMLVKAQDYSNIKEWIVINGSNTTETPLLDAFIEELKADSKMPLIKYHKSEKKTIGGYRNDCHKYVTSDIIVCFDDDDYYPPQRVSHAVSKLSKSKCALAGCCDMYIYDIHIKKVYQFGNFGNNHSVNNCFAYTNEYMKTHSYNESRTFGEEEEFTEKFTIPMIQLDPARTVVQISHTSNTFNKKIVIFQNYFLEPSKKTLTLKTASFKEIVKNNAIYAKYVEIFAKLMQTTPSPYDIVYYTSLFSIKWDPKDKSLGGSEQAIVELSKEWVKRGLKVAVYGNFETDYVVDGVEYLDAKKFDFNIEYNHLILWRLYGLKSLIEYVGDTLKAKHVWIDLHDNIPETYEIIKEHQHKISGVFFKSAFHKQMYHHFTKSYDEIKSSIIPNGVRVEAFKEDSDAKGNEYIRMPFRMCYCSCYTRGLERILTDIFPIVYKMEPRAELHVYYGMDHIMNVEYVTKMKQLLSQPGVMDHGRQPLELINREKHMSTFQLYYTESMAEIDCISIRESLVAGCIPILSNVNVFAERQGIHLPWMPSDKHNNIKIALEIVKIMQNAATDDLREQGYRSSTILNWSQVAQAWLTQFKQV
jgi:glycosyltransferase involved in cell wall biosynthesis